MNKRTLRLTESDLHNIITESVKNILKEMARPINPQAVYIVCDGSSYYGVYGSDVQKEIDMNDAEIVKGPFAKWDTKVDDLIEQLNDELNGTSMYR